MHNLSSAWRATAYTLASLTSGLAVWFFTDKIVFLWKVMGTSLPATLFLWCLLGLALAVTGFVLCLACVVGFGTHVFPAWRTYYNLTDVRYMFRTIIKGSSRYIVLRIVGLFAMIILDLALLMRLVSPWMSNWGVVFSNAPFVATIVALLKLLLIGVGAVVSMWALIACIVPAVVYMNWHYRHALAVQIASSSCSALGLLDRLRVARYVSRIVKRSSHAESATPETTPGH